MKKTKKDNLIIYLLCSSIIALVVIFVPFQSSNASPTSLEVINPSDILTNELTLEKYLAVNGPKTTLETLLAKSIETGQDCHQPAHKMGRLGYEMYGKDVFKESSAKCHSGAYHGAMESFLNEVGTQNLAANIKNLCQSFDTNFGTFECLHGAGHGVLAYVGYNVPLALNQCKTLEDSWSQASCYGGVFMENIMTGLGQGAGDGHQTIWLNRQDPYFPCNKVDQDQPMQYECYMMQTSWMFEISGWNFDTVVANCANAIVEMVPVCYQSYGRDIAGHTNRDAAQILSLCSKIPQKNYQQNCLMGAANVIVEFWGPDLKTQATELCKLAKDDQKDICYETLSGRLHDVFTDRSRQKLICQSFETNYQGLCKEYLD